MAHGPVLDPDGHELPLGFGDITFTSDLGRLFSIIVMLSGVVFLLIVFPFTFIQFFYAPGAGPPRTGPGPRASCRRVFAATSS